MHIGQCWLIPVEGSGTRAVFRFQGLHFAESSHMPLFVGKFRTHKRPHQILGKSDANDPGTEDKHVDIVVLNSLMR